MTATETAGRAEQLLDTLLPAFCQDCGGRLARPGEPCSAPACGAVPPITRAEAAARLEEPGAVATIEAGRLRAEARQLQEQVSALLLQADMTEHAGRLTQARDQAAAPIQGARTEVARLGKELKRAQAREAEAAQRVEDSREHFRAMSLAEESARRTFAPAAERTDALVKMNAAGSVLQADQGALQGASAVRQQADGALGAARSRLASLEAGLLAAQKALDAPGRPPRSAVTLTMDLARQVLAGDLEPGEEAFVRSLGEALARFSGASADIAERAVANAERERREGFRKSPAYLRPRSDGQVDVIANPDLAGKPGGALPPPPPAHPWAPR